MKQKFRDYIVSLVRSEKEGQLQNVELHLENISKLVVSTTNNLESVGENLIGIHQSLSAQIENLKQEQAAMSHQLNNLNIGNIIWDEGR